MIGLERGAVRLVAHQEAWADEAASTIEELKTLLGETAVDIQHVGSTAIPAIHAKPILDIVIGVRSMQDVPLCIEKLNGRGFVYRGEDVPGQALFVKGDFEKNIRTHHIHVVPWQGQAWNNYLNFRDYLNACPEKAEAYDSCKQRLASQFPENRKSYTAGKEKLVDALLAEAAQWRANQETEAFQHDARRGAGMDSVMKRWTDHASSHQAAGVSFK